MVRHQSALKAARQAVKRQARNQAARANLRTTIKKLRTTIATAGSNKEEAKKALPELLNNVQSILMKAANKNLIKRETASRQIARLSTAISKATA